MLNSMPSGMTDYLAVLHNLGDEIAYAQREGYRMVRYSYRDVARMAYGFSAELAARGIRKGDRVGWWCPNSAEWVAAFWGCAYRGVIAVPMDEAASPDFATRVFQHVDAKLLASSRDHTQRGLPTFV